MIDREKVMKGLECCIRLDGGTMRRSCESCPYNDNREEWACISIIPLMEDALALLKADQAQLVDLRKRLEAIDVIAFDYDGERTVEGLMSLIDELRDIALRGVPEEVTDDAD